MHPFGDEFRRKYLRKKWIALEDVHLNILHQNSSLSVSGGTGCCVSFRPVGVNQGEKGAVDSGQAYDVGLDGPVTRVPEVDLRK